MALAPQAKAYYRIDCSRPPTACDRLRRGALDWGLYCESSLQGRTGVSFLTGRLPGLLRSRSRCHACLIAQFTLSVSPSSTQLLTDLRVHSSDPSQGPSQLRRSRTCDCAKWAAQEEQPACSTVQQTNDSLEDLLSIAIILHRRYPTAHRKHPVVSNPRQHLPISQTQREYSRWES